MHVRASALRRRGKVSVARPSGVRPAVSGGGLEMLRECHEIVAIGIGERMTGNWPAPRGFARMY